MLIDIVRNPDTLLQISGPLQVKQRELQDAIASKDNKTQSGGKKDSSLKHMVKVMRSMKKNK